MGIENVRTEHASALSNDPEVMAVKMDWMSDSEACQVLNDIDCPSRVCCGDFNWLDAAYRLVRGTFAKGREDLLVFGWEDALFIEHAQHCWVGPVKEQSCAVDGPGEVRGESDA